VIQHTLILTTQRKNIPNEGYGYIGILKLLIENNLTSVDYFGAELDNQADYIDNDMQVKIDNNVYINIYFETTVEIEYSLQTDEKIYCLLIDLLDNSINSETRVNDNDIDIYIN
jgi:hypothetical protein